MVSSSVFLANIFDLNKSFELKFKGVKLTFIAEKSLHP